MQVGDKIRDYVLEEKIGSGGVGEVWRARHARLDKIVAIKFMFAHLAEDPDFQDRFLREAVTMANLDHPSIVSVTDYFSNDEQTCLVMVHVECGSLRDWIKEKSRFGEEETIQITASILSALDYAHKRGVIHRDVKPSNILMDINGRPHLTDFGIVLLTSEQRLTTTGTFMGTVEYMSPEQIQAVKGVTGHSDQYSCGCVMYELLTGSPPCGSRDGGDTEFTIMRRHTNEAPPGIRELNPSISEKTATAVMRSLAKDPSKRFASCDEMIQELGFSGVQLAMDVPVIRSDARDTVVSAQSSAIVVPKSISDKALSNQTSDILIPKGGPVVAGDTMVSNQSKGHFPATEKLTAAEVAVKKQQGQNQAAQAGVAAPVAVKSGSGNKKGAYALLLSLAIFSGSALAYVLFKDTLQVRGLLSKAEKAYTMGDYETPEGQSALDYYKQALEIDQDNSKALDGVTRLANHYLKLSKDATAKREYAYADLYADSAGKLADLHPRLAGIGTTVEADKKIRLAEMQLEKVESEKEKIKQQEELKLSEFEKEKEKLQYEKEKLSTERVIVQKERMNLERRRELEQIRRQQEQQRRSNQRKSPKGQRQPTNTRTSDGVVVGTPKDVSVIKATPMKVIKKKSTPARVEKETATVSRPSTATKPTKLAVQSNKSSPVLDQKPIPRAEPRPEKTKTEINDELKGLYKTGRALLKKRDMTIADITQARQIYNDMESLSQGHKLARNVLNLTLRACYTLGRKTLKTKEYDKTQDIIDMGLKINAKDKRMKKLQKLLDRQIKKE